MSFRVDAVDVVEGDAMEADVRVSQGGWQKGGRKRQLQGSYRAVGKFGGGCSRRSQSLGKMVFIQGGEIRITEMGEIRPPYDLGGSGARRNKYF